MAGRKPFYLGNGSFEIEAKKGFQSPLLRCIFLAIYLLSFPETQPQRAPGAVPNCPILRAGPGGRRSGGVTGPSVHKEVEPGPCLP